MNNNRCNPCQFCQHYHYTPATYWEPDDEECTALEQSGDFEPGRTPCKAFKPFLPSDNLYYELDMEMQYCEYLECETRERELTDKEYEGYAKINGITVQQAKDKIKELTEDD